MILETMFRRLKVLNYMKQELVSKGHSFRQLSYINSQIELLSNLIKQEAFNILDILLNEKTYYRLLKKINKGTENLVDILKQPAEWRLCEVENHTEEWFNKDSLIFTTENEEVMVFTKNNHGQKYTNNKWQ